jgi:hypothetical protein
MLPTLSAESTYTPIDKTPSDTSTSTRTTVSWGPHTIDNEREKNSLNASTNEPIASYNVTNHDVIEWPLEGNLLDLLFKEIPNLFIFIK